MKWHPSLTIEKWRELPLETRIAHVQSEIVRALDAQRTGYCDSATLALERALELAELTIETCIGHPKLRDLCRWRERIAKCWLLPEDELPEDLVEPRWDNPYGGRWTGTG